MRFHEGSDVPGRFDAVIAIFFLHHLADAELADLPRGLKATLADGECSTCSDPSL